MGSRSFNIPNLLSLSRILLAPFVMVLLLYTRVGRGIPFLRNLGLDLTYSDLAAALVFIVAALTDTADEKGRRLTDREIRERAAEMKDSISWQ